MLNLASLNELDILEQDSLWLRQKFGEEDPATVNVEWDPRLRALTPESTTSAYSTVSSIYRMRGENLPAYGMWLDEVMAYVSVLSAKHGPNLTSPQTTA